MTERNLTATLTDAENQPHQYYRSIGLRGDRAYCVCGTSALIGTEAELEEFVDLHKSHASDYDTLNMLFEPLDQS